MSKNASECTKAGTQRLSGYIPIGFAVAAVFLAPFIASKFDPFGTSVIRTLIFFTALLFLIAWKSTEIRVLPNRIIPILSAILLLMGVASLCTLTCIHTTLMAVLDLAAFLTILLLIASLSERDIYMVLASLLVSAVLVAVIGVREYLLSPAIDWRIFSTFFNPDFLAGFTALMLPLALAWYLSESALIATTTTAISVLALTGALLLTGSRFGLLAAVIGLAAFCISAMSTRAFRKAQKRRVLTIILPLVLVILGAKGPILGRVTSTQTQSHSGSFRIATWEGTLRMAKSHPLFGTGLGTFELAYPEYADVGFTKLAHNSYLQLAAEAGLASPIVLLLLIGSGVLTIAHSLQSSRGQSSCDASTFHTWQPNRSLILSGIIGSIAASCARNLIDSDWYVASIAISFAVILGAGLAHAPRKRWASANTVLRGSLVCAYLSLTVVCLVITLAIILEKQGDALLASGDFKKALNAYQTALRLDPLNPEYRKDLSQLHAIRSAKTGEMNDLYIAERYMKSAIKIQPTCARNYYQLGKIYELANKDEQALKAFEQALKRDPHALPALLAEAKLYERTSQMKHALAVYRRMVEIENSQYEKIRAMPEFIEPSYAFAHYALGLDYERRGDCQLARKEFQKALERIKAYKNSLKVVGPILEASGRRDYWLESELENITQEISKRLKPGHL